MNSYPINLLFFRTNSQVCRGVEQEPSLHPRPAVRGGEPRGEPRQDQVCSNERFGRQSQARGKYSFPRSTAEQRLGCVTTILILILILICEVIQYSLLSNCCILTSSLTDLIIYLLFAK